MAAPVIEAQENTNAVPTIPAGEQKLRNRRKIQIVACFDMYKMTELPKNKFTEVTVVSSGGYLGYVRMNVHEDEINEMAQLIQETEAESAKCEPELTKLVLVKHEANMLRAIIMSVSPKLRVRFIDTGEEVTITPEDILQMPEKLAAVPAYAICVKTPFQMQNGQVTKMKPLRKEFDVTVVEVED